MKRTYTEFVHNLNGNSFKGNTRNDEAIVSYLKESFRCYNELQESIVAETSEEVLKYIAGHLDLEKYFRNILLATASKSYCSDLDFNNIRAIINLKEINYLKDINEHFRSVNRLLPDAGIYIGRAVTYYQRKLQIHSKYGKYAGRTLWLCDFIINRIIPKLRGFEHIYKFFTGGTFHTLSLAELLGRLVYSGFEIIEYKSINKQVYFAAMKTNGPSYYKNPTYRPVIKLLRVGKRSKIIGVYKFRTMHPYSEYLQDFVLKLNGYNEFGKPAEDFRVTSWGKALRKIWLDEFPQLINVLKGEMKLVGIRPVSKVRFEQFPPDIQSERIKHKPGCIPPYVSLNMPDATGNIEAERIYFNDLKKHPYTTNLKYMFKAIFNIVTNKIRSS